MTAMKQFSVIVLTVMLTTVGVPPFSPGAGLLTASAAEPPGVAHPAPPALPTWAHVRSVPMKGDLRIFWNVGGGDRDYNNLEAVAHGFRLVNLLNTYADYPGCQKEKIAHALEGNRTNPWKEPDSFERIIRRNIANAGRDGEIFVHDIEFQFEEDINKAREHAGARAAFTDEGPKGSRNTLIRITLRPYR